VVGSQFFIYTTRDSGNPKLIDLGITYPSPNSIAVEGPDMEG